MEIKKRIKTKKWWCHHDGVIFFPLRPSMAGNPRLIPSWFRLNGTVILPPLSSYLKPSLFPSKAPTSHPSIATRPSTLELASPPRPLAEFVDSGEDRRSRSLSPLSLPLWFSRASLWQLLVAFVPSDRRVRPWPDATARGSFSGEPFPTSPCTPSSPPAPPSPPRPPLRRGMLHSPSLPSVVPERASPPSAAARTRVPARPRRPFMVDLSWAVRFRSGGLF